MYTDCWGSVWRRGVDVSEKTSRGQQGGGSPAYFGNSVHGTAVGRVEGWCGSRGAIGHDGDGCSGSVTSQRWWLLAQQGAHAGFHGLGDAPQVVPEVETPTNTSVSCETQGSTDACACMCVWLVVCVQSLPALQCDHHAPTRQCAQHLSHVSIACTNSRLAFFALATKMQPPFTPHHAMPCHAMPTNLQPTCWCDGAAS